MMNRHLFFLISISLCVLLGFIGLYWVSGTLSQVYVHSLYGRSIFGGQPGSDDVVACVGLPHLDKAGFIFCQGDLIYHPWAYNPPIDDREFLKEIQDMKFVNRER